MIKKIPFSEALGQALSHDITEIQPDRFKGAAFKNGVNMLSLNQTHF